MARLTRREYLTEILDFILNQATEDELDAIFGALERRGRRQSTQELHFGSMAKDMMSRFDFEMPDFHGMSRQMVKNIILENVEEISAHDLEVLLDHYVPPPGKERPSVESSLPADALQSMMRQFIAYSLGRMPKEEERELRARIPDWPQRYWSLFSAQTQQWIQKTIGEFRA